MNQLQESLKNERKNRNLSLRKVSILSEYKITETAILRAETQDVNIITFLKIIKILDLELKLSAR